VRAYVRILLLCATALFADPVALVVQHAHVARDTLVSVCASIENRSGKAFRTFPPAFGAYGFAHYGFLRGPDTLWVRGYPDVDLQARPPVRIPAGSRFTWNFRVELRDLHFERLGGQQSVGFPSFLYEANGFRLIYETGWPGSGPPKNAKKWAKYDRMSLVSPAAPLEQVLSVCDTGIQRIEK